MLRFFLKSRAILALMAALGALLVSTPAWALTTGQLRVTVQDDTELPIPGVSLVLSSEVLIGGQQERTTDENGEALFVELPPGKYRVVATKAGFGGVTIDGIGVDVNRTSIQIVTMVPGAVEEIEVVAQQQAVDTESTTRGQVLTKEFLQKVPAGRDYQSAVQLATGVQPGTGGNPSMGGAAFNENTYMLDGANITDPVTGTFSLNFNFDAIQQIEVLLGGYMPEYGTSLGGIVNIVTQSGTNNLEFLGSVYYNNGNLFPRDDERLAADGITIAPTDFDSEFQTIDVSTVLSGPVIRDKAWFIVSYQSSRSIIALTGVPQARDYDGHYLLAKLTWQPSTEHRLSAFFQTNPTTIDNGSQFTSFIKAEAQERQAQGGFVANGRWQWFLSPEVNLDTAFLVQKIFIEVNGVPCTHDRSRRWNPCDPGEPEGFIDWETPGRGGVAGAYESVNYNFFYFDDRYRYDASTKLSVLSVDDPLGGTHDLKFGAGGSQLIWDQIQGFNGNTYYVDINAVSFDPQSFQNYYWIETTGPIKFRTTASEYHLFAQDSWKPVSNLTINYGSRFDSFVMRNDLGEPVLQGNLLGPRLFGAWDPWGDQRTKIATGYGRFNDTGRLSVASFTSAANFGQKLYLGEYFAELGLPSGGGFMNSQNLVYLTFPKDNLATAWENLRSPRVDELILILEREIIEDVAVFSSMSGKFTRFGYEYDEVNLIYDSDGSAIIGSRLGDYLNVYPRLRTPLLAKRDYFQWDLGVNKIESRRWAASATYSYTTSVGSSEQALSGAFGVDPQTQYNYGPLYTSLAHTVKAYGWWDLPTDPWTQQVGFAFVYYDGFPDERLYPSESFGRSLRIRPRGSYYKFNPYWYLSLMFTQSIDVRKGSLELNFQAENVFNNRAPDFPDYGFIDTDNRLVVASRQNPLRLQFGVRYEF